MNVSNLLPCQCQLAIIHFVTTSGGPWDFMLGGGHIFKYCVWSNKTLETTPKGFYCITLSLEGKKLFYGEGVEKNWYIFHQLFSLMENNL